VPTRSPIKNGPRTIKDTLVSMCHMRKMTGTDVRFWTAKSSTAAVRPMVRRVPVRFIAAPR
jgi:hypothetical protein